MRRRAGQVLVFDADDTLWENNIRYERVVDDFLEWLAYPTLDPTAIRAIIDDIQAANARIHGYGPRMFLRSLRDCLERLRERPATAVERQRLDELAVALVTGRIDLMPGVSDTLSQLKERHDLLLLTKGQLDEQHRKLDASGLAPYFRQVHVVREKDEDAYRWLTAHHGLTPAGTWMIGNSPASDIIPARRAGLNAVYIPCEHTWSLENGDIDPADSRVLRLKTFPELLDHF